MPAPTADDLYHHHRFTDPLPFLKTIKVKTGLRVEVKNAHAKLHSQLPETSLWTYDGFFPGPVLEVEKGHRVAI